jgi:NAD-dependent deacetylase
MNKTKEFYRFYMDKLICENVYPNDAHKVLAQMEEDGKLISIVTQNIDGLHQMAGSKNVFELHGSTYRNYCMKCHRRFGINDMVKFKEDKVELPTCECGGIIKPDVVLYEEGLSEEVLEGAINSIQIANTLIIAGTSLTVYPAAGLVRYFRGDNLVLINRDSTPVDKNADLVIHDNVGKVLKEAYGLV